MNKPNKLISRIIHSAKITQSEFYVALVLVCGLAFGVVGRHFFSVGGAKNVSAITADSLNKILDSAAIVHQQTLVGTNIDNEPVPELAKLDTISRQYKPKKSDFKGIVNLNTASKTQLMQLYNIGDKTASKIIEHRSRAPFRRKEDILNVKGIGVKTYEKIKNNIAV